MIAFILTNVLGWKNEAEVVLAFQDLDVQEYWKLQGKRSAMRQSFFEAWQAQKFDVVLSPGHMMPAVPHKSFKDLSHAAAYNGLYNLLDFPAGVVPITHVKSTDTFPHAPRTLFQKKVQQYHNPKEDAGLPVGVQVAGLPFKEETVLRAMRVLSELVPFQSAPEHRK